MNVNISFPLSSKHRPLSLLFLLLLSLVISNGCVVKDMGNVVKHNVTGDYFLSTEEYSRGAENFQQEVAKNPDSVLANYYYGRFLLGTKQYKEVMGSGACLEEFEVLHDVLSSSGRR